MENNSSLGSLIATIILIALIIVAVIGLIALAIKVAPIFRVRVEPVIYEDVYDPRNSTLQEAYDNCIAELEQLNYTIYNAAFRKEVWVKAENFSVFLELASEYDAPIIFVDAPKGRGWILGHRTSPFKAYIWFNEKLPNDETITIYYQLHEK